MTSQNVGKNSYLENFQEDCVDPPHNGQLEDPLRSLLSPQIAIWLPILQRLRVSLLDILRLEAAAQANGTDFQAELISSNLVEERDLFREIAREFDLEFVERIDPAKLTTSDEDCAKLLRSRAKYMRGTMITPDGRARSLFVPCGLPLTDLQRVLHRSSAVRTIICMTSPGALRGAAHARLRRQLAVEARSHLSDRYPIFSAKMVMTGWQGILIGASVVLIVGAFLVETTAAFIAMHVFFSLFFLGCVVLRVAASNSRPPIPPPDLAQAPMSMLPFYSVLVALHHEAEIVPQLIAALERIRWPRSKLEIKFVCEADDSETLGALAKVRLPPHCEVVEVPPGLPRTKPKALSFGLQLIKGDYVVLYDAEDRPHPLQLLEAWRRFQDSDDDLACVQAPLQITNGHHGLIPLLFAFEYSALFRGLLPWLSGHRALLPLGGTSNHFRVDALEEVGGWDPYNVTEDADLGLRLARFGYRTATISLPTLEDAPQSLSVWLPQRTRWFKGWATTWLVHMREPTKLYRDVGLASFCLVQILYAGLLISALFHPLLIVAAFWLVAQLATSQPMTGWGAALLAIDGFNIVCGYSSFLMLGWYSLRRPHRHSLLRIVLFTPVYWMMLSVAAWRALVQLRRDPHHWEKTPHFRTARRQPKSAAAFSVSPAENPARSR